MLRQHTKYHPTVNGRGRVLTQMHLPGSPSMRSLAMLPPTLGIIHSRCAPSPAKTSLTGKHWQKNGDTEKHWQVEWTSRGRRKQARPRSSGSRSDANGKVIRLAWSDSSWVALAGSATKWGEELGWGTNSLKVRPRRHKEKGVGRDCEAEQACVVERTARAEVGQPYSGSRPCGMVKTINSGQRASVAGRCRQR